MCVCVSVCESVCVSVCACVQYTIILEADTSFNGTLLHLFHSRPQGH